MLRINNMGLRLDRQLKVYHASVAIGQIIKDQSFKSREQLRQQGAVKTGAGGGPERAISFTGDIRVAQSICVGLGAIVRISLDDLDTQTLISELRIAAPKAFHMLWNEGLRDIRGRLAPKDTLELYLTFLNTGYGTREIFDPAFVGTSVRMFQSSDLSLLDSIGIVSARLDAGTLVFPRTSDDFSSILSRNITFEIQEPIFERGFTPYSDCRLKEDDIKSSLRYKIYRVENDSITDNFFVENNFVSYLKALNEFRVWSNNAVVRGSIQEEDNWSSICLYTLPAIWDKIGVYSFYPYFEYPDLIDNI